jgi:hypothetical protein
MGKLRYLLLLLCTIIIFFSDKLISQNLYSNFQNASSFDNGDFEASVSGVITSSNQVSGWVITRGAITTSVNPCNVQNCCFNDPLESAIITNSVNGYIDPNIGSIYPIYSVFGDSVNNGSSVNPSINSMYGSSVLRINSTALNYGIEKATKTFTIMPSNALFQLAFIGLFFEGHTCCDGTSFLLKITNVSTNSLLTCPGLSITAPSSACSITSNVTFYPTSSGYKYNKWVIVGFDLSQYIGDVISIDLIATDCVLGGHHGIVYLDSKNQSMSIQCNSNTFSAESGTISLPSCGSSSFIIQAPPGLGPYSWSGPGINLQQSTPSFSNQNITLFNSGTYTLTMNPMGACSPINKVLNAIITPSVSPLSILGLNSICANTNVSLTATGALTYSWSNGVTTNTLIDSPQTNTLYVVNGWDINNCPSSNTINVTVTQQPTLNITGSNTVCLGSSVTYTLSGANDIFWNSNQITNTVNVMPLSNTSYSVLGMNNSCSVTAQVNLTVNPNCSFVWPGDANSDGTVNILDVLELGLHFNQSGSPRNPVSNSWTSWYADNWVGTITGGKNRCHADCNGDGVVNVNDSLPIWLNYNMNHAFKESAELSLMPQLHLTSDSAYISNNQWGSVSIFLGDTNNLLTDINGLGFHLNFDNAYIQSDSIYIEYPVSFLNVGNNNFHFNKRNFQNEVIYSATTHTNNIDVSGNGKIAKFHFKIVQNIGVDTVLKITLLNAYKSNSTGSISAITTGSVSVKIKAIDVGLSEFRSDLSIKVFPNPSDGMYYIKSVRVLSDIKVYSIDGRLILDEKIKDYQYSLNLSTHKSGLYFLKIIDTDNNYKIEKISLIK